MEKSENNQNEEKINFFKKHSKELKKYAMIAIGASIATVGLIALVTLAEQKKYNEKYVTFEFDRKKYDILVENNGGNKPEIAAMTGDALKRFSEENKDNVHVI